MLTVTNLTDVTPALLRIFAQLLHVVPVVLTSSTKSTFIPLTIRLVLNARDPDRFLSRHILSILFGP